MSPFSSCPRASLGHLHFSESNAAGVGALQSTEVLQQSKSQWAVCFLKSCPVLSDKVEHETCTAKCTSPLLRRASMGSSLRSGDFEERLVLSKANSQAFFLMDEFPPTKNPHQLNQLKLLLIWAKISPLCNPNYHHPWI